MKEIKAFIHHSRIADVLHALKNARFCAGSYHISINNVSGVLQALDSKEQNYSIELGEGVITEIKLELICEDERVNEAIALIRDKARTGQPLSGWIYLYDIAEAIAIEGD